MNFPERIHASLMTHDAELLFMAYWPFVSLLWREVYSNLLPIFKWSYLSFLLLRL